MAKREKKKKAVNDGSVHSWSELLVYLELLELEFAAVHGLERCISVKPRHRTLSDQNMAVIHHTQQ
jgi:hypothetical protein